MISTFILLDCGRLLPKISPPSSRILMARQMNTLSSDEPLMAARPRALDRTANAPDADTLRPEYVPGMPILPDDMDAEAMARRRLLKIAAYTVPLVVGSMITGPAEAALSAGDPGCENSRPGKNPNCD